MSGIIAKIAAKLAFYELKVLLGTLPKFIITSAAMEAVCMAFGYSSCTAILGLKEEQPNFAYSLA